MEAEDICDIAMTTRPDSDENLFCWVIYALQTMDDSTFMNFDPAEGFLKLNGTGMPK